MHRHVSALALSLSLVVSAGTAAAGSLSPPGATPPIRTQPAGGAGAPAATGPSLRSTTHSFVFPNGNTLPAGAVELRSTMFGGWNTVAVGVTDRLELHVSAPLSPVLASAGVRFGLLGGRSPFRLTLGAAGWVPLGQDAGGYAVSGSVTAAYSTARFNLHGTVSALRASGTREMPHLYNVGLSYRIGEHVALLGEAVRLWIPTGVECADVVGGGQLGGGCSETGDTIDAVVVGAKLMGEHFDADVGLAVPRHAFTPALRALPVVSVSYRF